MGGGGIQLHAVGIRVSGRISGELHNGQLHSQTKSKEWYAVFPGILDGVNLSVNAAVAKAAGYQDTAHIFKDFGGIFRRDCLGIHPFDVDRGTVGHPAVLQGFHHGNVGIVKLGVFAYQGHGHILLWMLPGLYHGPPVCQVRLRTGQIEAFTGGLGQMLFLHYKGYFIEHVHIQVLEYVMFGNIAELGDFRLDAVVQGEFAAAD